MIPIHIAKIYPFAKMRYLFLKKSSTHTFEWVLMHPNFEEESATGIGSDSVSKAFKEGYQYWHKSYFQLLNCGFRYTLPERDPVGSNALFWQMALSYNSSNGRYFDEEAGHLCYVDFASEEALKIWKIILQLKPLDTTRLPKS